ncbi:MAG: iron-containing alcohol dehydrogenase [Firmicutes bacterium]|nr:iron-containing alcohol dehydrogenase [Bacillota bacterium]
MMDGALDRRRAISFHAPVRLHMGPGAVDRVGELARPHGARALVVTGRHAARRTGALDRVLGSLRRAGLEVEVWDGVTPNPEASTVDQGARHARQVGADVLVGLGGGSAMDTAKLIAVLVRSGGSAWEYAPIHGPTRRRPTGALPVLAVPTTSGTGSHVNATAVVTHPEGREKLGIWHPLMYPKEAVVDVELLASMPVAVTRATGLDVLFQCIEPYVGRRASPFTDILAEEGMRLVRRYLVRAVRDGSDMEARAGMAVADTLAGIAIDQAGVGLIHGLEHPVSGRHGAVHGEGLAALAPAVMAFNLPARLERFARIAELLGQQTAGLPLQEAARLAIVAVEELLQETGATWGLQELGVQDADVAVLVDDTLRSMQGAVANNPRESTPEELAELYRRSLPPLGRRS